MVKLLFLIAIIGAIFGNAFQYSTFFNPIALPHNLSLSNSKRLKPLQMIFGPPKDDGTPGDYVCKDCGYVFTKGSDAWAKLPEKGACPPCGAPKFRFKKVAKGSADGKVEVKKGWF